MNQFSLRSFVLGRIQETGRRLGAPTVRFADRIITVQGEDFRVKKGVFHFITQTTGYYLALPANVFGVVIFPDGTSHNMEGGVHELPPGLYKIQYVDKQERMDYLSPVSEMSTDGEKITLKVVVRYRVIDPIVALRINRPVETLVEHMEADVAQYIRTHDHSDIADSSEHDQESKLLSYFAQRHNRRFPLSRAFILTGIEIKDFAGDNEYVEMRRKASMELRKNRIEKEQAAYRQELEQIKAQYKVETEKAMAEHNAELLRKATEHRAEIETMQARHEREKQEILEQVRLREIDLEHRRTQLQRHGNEFAQILETLSRQFASGTPMNAAVLKTFLDLLAAYKEEMDIESQTPVSSRPASNGSPPPPHSSTASSNKVEHLKNTLLNLLGPKK